MNLSENPQELLELHIPSGDYCFAYANEDLIIQVSTRGTEPTDLVIAFVSYMKAIGFAPETIEAALHNKANTMKRVDVCPFEF
jgi:hypothetical protein